MAMDTNYVINRNQVLKNFKTLISYRNSSDKTKSEYYEQRLKSGKTFIVEIINGNVEFAPSKFVGYRSNTMGTHERKHSISRSGDLTDKNFKNIYGIRLQFDDLLDSALQSFYLQHNIDGTTSKPKARLHYFILPDIYERIKSIMSSTPQFFKIVDIVKYSVYAGKPYRKNNPKHMKIGKEIREKLYDKTNYWLNSISVPHYKKETNSRWQIGGHFAHYTWGRIFKEKDSSRLIYFTVGISYEKQALIYKLDCQRNSPAGGIKLNKEQISRFDNFISGTDSEWVQIDLPEIKRLNWEKLIERTNSFIKKYDKLYENAIKYVWGNKKFKQPKNSLEEVDPPDPQNLPPFQPSFKGHKTDYLKKHRESKKLGKSGELLVIEYEKKRLGKKLKKGMGIKHISKDEGDGTGYDIKSYDVNGNEIFIEVKTTKSKNKDTPFNITQTELEFSKQNSKSFWLYRVYNYNKTNNTGRVYRIKGNLYKLLDKRPDSYVAVFKGKGG